MTLGVAALIAFLVAAVALDRAVHRVLPEAEEEAVRSLAQGLWALLRGAFWLTRKTIQLVIGRVIPALVRGFFGFLHGCFRPGPGRAERAIGGFFVIVFGIPMALYAAVIVARELLRAASDALGAGIVNLEMNVEARVPGHPTLPRPGAPPRAGANPGGHQNTQATSPVDALHVLFGLPLWLWAPIVALVAIGLALLAVQMVCTQRTLRTRQRFVLSLRDEHDPRPEDVDGFVRQLAGVRRRNLVWLDRRACAVSLILTTTGMLRRDRLARELSQAEVDGREARAAALRAQLEREKEVPVVGIEPGLPLLVMECAERHVGALRSALAAGYPTVDLVSMEEFPAPPPDPGEGRRHVKRLELVTKHELAALARPGHSVLESLVRGVMAQVNVARGDQLWVRVDLDPLAPRERERLRDRWLGKARKRDDRRERREAARSEDGKRPRRGVAEQVERRSEREALGARLSQQTPLFRVQVLLSAEAACPEPGRGRWIPGRYCCANDEHASGLAHKAQGALEAVNGPNYVRTRGLSVFGLTHLGASLPLVRGYFDLRMRRGLMR